MLYVFIFIKDLFSTCGEIIGVKIVKAKNCAFVRFKDPESAIKAHKVVQLLCLFIILKLFF
jgi:RNA recognition motif-containing protein